MDDKVSVLMSVYYKENAVFFDASLRSVLFDQTKKPDEFVLVCDGALNNELDEIIDRYQNEFLGLLKVYRLEQNQGLGKALNFGLSQCTYDIVVRADSDDICAPERIANQVDYLNNHIDVSIVSSYIDEFEDDFTKPITIKTLPLNHEELASMAKFRNPINHMAVAFRKKAILSIGSYHHLPFVEDYELWVRAIINGYKLGNIDKVLVHARVGNGMVKRRGNKQYIKSWRTLSKYMLENKMINQIEYYRNMVFIRAFVFAPVFLKKYFYKKTLRKRAKA